jgi:predicted ABC-type ATPase
MTKWLWIVAGPNGAGKSTLTEGVIKELQSSGLIRTEIIKLNADERTAQLKKLFPDRPENELNLQAAQETDAALEKSIADEKPVIFIETVLSSTKYQDDVLEAKSRGYNVGLIYVSIHPPELILNRIKTRVALGGHNVEEERALKRYKKSHSNLIWFGRYADKLMIFDNSDIEKSPVLVAMKEAGKKLVHRVKGINPSIEHAIKILQKNRPALPSLDR